MKEHEKFGRAYASKLDARAATTTGFIQKKCNRFSRISQGSQTVQKCTLPVYSNKALRLELFASPTSLHFSVHLS